MDVIEKTAARKSTPMTSRDLADLERLKTAPEYQGRSESSILSEMMRLGLAAAREKVEAAGYAQMAAQEAATSQERKAAARRRRPSWADED